MKIKRFKELYEAEVSQIPQTNLHRYFQWFKKWCDEEGIEPDFSKISKKEIIEKGIKYAKKHNLPNMFYYGDNGE